MGLIGSTGEAVEGTSYAADSGAKGRSQIRRFGQREGRTGCDFGCYGSCGNVGYLSTEERTVNSQRSFFNREL